jgi:hypothetical protein
MNNTRRKKIAAIQERLSALMDEIDDLYTEELEAFENLPESLQCSSKGEKMEEAIDALEEARNGLEEVITEYLETAME